jgi:hypothetical protein
VEYGYGYYRHYEPVADGNVKAAASNGGRPADPSPAASR